MERDFKKSRIYSLVLIMTLLVSGIFISVRKVINLPESWILGQYSDFTSISFYLSDIIGFCLLCTVFYFKYAKKWKYRMSDIYIFLIFWLILKVLIFPLEFNRLLFYSSLKLIFLIFVAYGTDYFIYKLKNHKISFSPIFIRLFLWFSAFESILAILQQIRQKSVGLYIFGESYFGLNITGTAKILYGGYEKIRSYGTFPHPNILSAILVFALGMCVYKLLESEKFKLKLLYSGLIFLNTLGLVVTFSRSGYLAYFFFLFIFFFGLTYSKYKISKFIYFVLPIISISIIFSYTLFSTEISTRSRIKDPAYTERHSLNKTGLNMVKNNPIFGVGTGMSVIHMEQYSDQTLKFWQKQPIHNYFLLSAAEIGLPGVILFICIFSYATFALYKKVFLNFSAYSLLLFGLFASIIFLMQFDHYFYTTNQTQLLLWIFLGLVSSETTGFSSKSQIT